MNILLATKKFLLMILIKKDLMPDDKNSDKENSDEENSTKEKINYRLCLTFIFLMSSNHFK